MIASISKTASYKKLIEYNEDKCKKGDASLIFNGVYTNKENVSNYVKAFDDHFCLYAKENIKNKIAHISLSLPKGETITDQEFVKIGVEYLHKMGYKDCPFLMYKHHDTQFNHIHMIVSSIDYNGKKVKEFNDFSRSQDISRGIEKKYKLKETEYGNAHENAELTEINFRKYYMHNAIKKASHGYNTKAWLEQFLNDREKKLIFTKKGLTQKQIKTVIGEEKFNVLYDFLYKKGLFNTLYKDEMRKLLDEILPKVSTMKDYINECKKHNIYVRVMTSKDKSQYLKYGMINEHVYFKDTNLSSRFRFDNLCQKFGYLTENNLRNKTESEQYSYLNKNINTILSNTGNFEIFKEKLANRGIETITKENSKGTYAISFKDCTCNNPLIYNGESFDLSWKAIQEKFEVQDLYVTTSFYTINQTPDFTIPLQPDYFVPSTKPKKPTDDYEDLSKKRKKKKNIGL